MTNPSMATPFADPRTGRLHFRRAVPEKLRAAFGGRAQVKITRRTKDPAAAKIAFARENAKFEEQLAGCAPPHRRWHARADPAALVARWCEGPAVKGGLTGPQRLTLTLMELDAAVGARHTVAAGKDPYPPAVMGPAANTDWSAVVADRERFEAILAESYGDDPEQTGSNWIRTRWHAPRETWMLRLAGPITRLRSFDREAALLG